MLKMICSIVTFFLFLISCGIKEPELGPLGEINKINKPNYTKSNASFSLRPEDENQKNFSGSMIIWNETADVKRVNRVINLSNLAKDLERDYKELLRENYKLQQIFAETNEQIEEIEGNLEKANSQHLRSFLEDQVNYQGLLKSHIEMAAGIVGENNKQQFENFCDAKYIDFLSSDLVLNEKYTTRPTPFSLCEGYYRAQKYFENESCQVSEEPKDFTHCFWSLDFLKKSNLDIYKKIDFVKQKVEKDTLDSEKLKQAWGNQDWKAYFASSKTLLLAGLVKLSANEKIYLYFDDPQRKIKEHLNPNLNGMLNVTSDIQKLLISRYLPNGEIYTFSDLLLNFRHMSEESKNYFYNIINDLDSFEWHSQSDPNLYGKSYAKLGLEETEDYKKLAQLKELVNENQKIEYEQQIKISEQEEMFLWTKAQIANDLSQYNLAYSLWPNMELKISKDDEGKMNVSWSLDHEKATMSFDAPLTKENTKLVGDEDEDNKLGDSLFDRKTGNLQFTLTEKNISVAGWDLYEKTTDSPRFNLLPKEDLLSKTISFDLSYTMYKESFPMFTGNVLIVDKGKTVYQGSILFTSF